jgi:hypothetical protein
MPLIWKYCCEYNNVNISCTKTIVPYYNAYKSTLDKIYVLTTHINVVLWVGKSNTFFVWQIRACHDH